MANEGYAYNPDDEEHEFWYNGTLFKLSPEVISELKIPLDGKGEFASQWKGWTAEDIATHAEETLKEWGVTKVPSFLILGEHSKNPSVYAAAIEQLEELKATAKKKWHTRCYSWATNLAMEYANKASRYVAGGVPRPNPTTEEAKALAWLEANKESTN